MKRKLTITFARAIGSVTAPPQEIEVVLLALGSESSSGTDTTYLPAPERRRFLLTAPEVKQEFDVTPSEDPSFEEPIHYRIAWRRGYLGKMESHDFFMPDKDVAFEDLLRLENIDPNRTLSESDLGKPGRVAQLSPTGAVQGSDGVALYTNGQIEDLLEEERTIREREDSGVLTYLNQALEEHETSVESTTRGHISDSERRTGQRISSVEQAYKDADEALRRSIIEEVGAGGNEVPENLLELLEAKADLENGKIKYEQLPEGIGQGELFKITSNDRLTTTQAEPGDMAVSPTDTWFLTGDSSEENDWVRISTLLKGVQSINGKTGDSVFINAEDVGARAAGNVPVSEVSGLAQEFAERLTGYIKEDEDGYIDTSLLRSDVPRIEGDRFFTAEGEEIAVRGDVTSVNGKTGEVTLNAEDVGARSSSTLIPIGEVDNLQSNLNLKVNVSDPRLTDARTPTAHAQSHGLGGSDQLTLEQGQITNLVEDLSQRATLDQFNDFRDAIYADLPENPEQQANAAGEFAALSITGANDSTDKLEQMSIYLNETNEQFTLFEENSFDFNLKYNDLLDTQEAMETAMTSIDVMGESVSRDKQQVEVAKAEVEALLQQANEATATAVLVAELLDYSINGGDVSVPRPLVEENSIEERHLSPELREKINNLG